MRSDRNYTIKNRQLILFILFLILIIQFSSISSISASNSNSSSSRQFGKSDITIYTSDVTNAGIDVPAEYENEVAMIKFSDPEPIEGESIIINATVFNVGTRGASATVYFYDGHPTEQDLIGIDNLSIHALGYSVASTPWDTSGEDEFHTIYVLINPEDPENESREDNNNATRDIIVNQIPIADAGADLGLVDYIYEDEIVYFDGTGSTDTDSDLIAGLIYTWNFSDPYADEDNPTITWGINLTKPSHYFTHQGLYTVNLTVEDDGGAFAWDIIRVKIVNEDPIAQISVPITNFDEDEEITFNAQESWDTPSDKAVLSYFWDFGDSTDSGWINQTTIMHSYPIKDQYDVELTVRDDDGAWDSKNLEVTVRNLPPIADAGEDIESSISSIIFDASKSWDTPSDLMKLNYQWSFGDSAKGYGRIVQHNYTEKGTYQVELTVTDDNDEKDSDRISVIIKNLSPIAIIQSQKLKANEDEEILFDGSGSYDPDGDILNYYWDFGDGTDSGEISPGHVFTASGLYQVTLRVEDSEGISGSSTIIVEILNVLPIANAGSYLEAYVGESLYFDASNTTDSPSDLITLEYYWDFDDNSTDEGIEVFHTFESPGIYEVVLTVKDDDNASAIHKIIVYIRDVLLSSISLTAELDQGRCNCGEAVEIAGELEFDFIKSDHKPDYTISRVRVEILETGENWIVHPDLDGDYRLTFNAPEKPGTYTIRVSITRLGIFAEEQATLKVQAKSTKQNEQYFTYDLTTTLIIASVGTAGVGIGAFTAGTDLGRFKFFSLLIPLYTRLNREALLDNFTRGRIYEHIRTNPGMHYRAIKDNLELSNGSLAYHLRVLEKERYIQSKTDGFCKRFYPVGMKITKGDTSNIQTLILDRIYEQPFITQKELAHDLGIDISTVNYHINMMAGAGVVKAEKIGRVKHYVVEAEVVEPIS
jgi:PKD repeat protein/DNA-binding MarR family transcriptional regulator